MSWNPKTYHLFRSERSQPFEDLLPLVELRTGLHVVDLGCGTGELTRRLADRLPGSTVVGVDSSPEMIAGAKTYSGEGLSFREGSIEGQDGCWDLIFSHAALHWVDDHHSLVPRLFSLLAPGGRIVAQIPHNDCHQSHVCIRETAAEEPFRSALGGWYRTSPVLEVDSYANLLYNCGASGITVFEKVYLHPFPEAGMIADWTAGTTLVPYFERLPQQLHEPFFERYRGKLRTALPGSPVLYTFRRIFFAATRSKPHGECGTGEP